MSSAIIGHKEAVALYIGTEDGCELACDLIVVFVGHVSRSPCFGLWFSEDDTVEIRLYYNYSNIQDMWGRVNRVLLSPDA